MKRLLWALLILLACLLFVSTTEVQASQYYRLQVGTDEWEAQTNTQDKVKQLQLNEIKTSLSTDELLTAVLEYPYLSDLYLANSLSSVIDQFALTFDGIKELIGRADLAETIFDRYMLLRLDKDRSESLLEQTFIEVLFAYQNLYEDLSEDQQVELFKQLEIVEASDRAFNRYFYEAQLPIGKQAAQSQSRTMSEESIGTEEKASSEVEQFSYAILPGTAEWNAETNTQVKVQLLQLGEIKTKLTTSELLTIVLEYPFLSDLYLANSMSTVVDDFATTFDGIKELLLRPDLVEHLLVMYQNLMNEKSSPDITLKSAFIEVLFASEYVYETLPPEDRDKIFDLIDINIESERAFGDIFFDALPSGSTAWYDYSSRSNQSDPPSSLTFKQEETTSEYNTFLYAWPKIKDVWLISRLINWIYFLG